MNFLLFSVIFVLFRTGLAEKLHPTPVIKIHSGQLFGQILANVRNSSQLYAAYTGIPFGEPPTGNLRFKAPVEKIKWKKTLDATNDGKVCVQPLIETGAIIGSEDCLYLSVYTPWPASKELKPVMFWIHGGSFTSSNLRISNSFRPDFILEEDVVVVSVNYRLGPLGFLNFHHKDAPGNAGLKDQNLAMKWVKKNIQFFGGDPDRVTIFGQSAGGVAVDYHLLSETSSGLFSQAISMSGSPLNLFWGLQTRESAKQAAAALGYKLSQRASRRTRNQIRSLELTNKNDLLLEYLKRSSAEDIIAEASSLSAMAFRVTIETKFKNEETFLSECSLGKYLSGNYNRVPYMTGFTSNEAKSFFLTSSNKYYEHFTTNIMKKGLKYLRDGRIPLDLSIFQEYLFSSESSGLLGQKKRELIETISDLVFVTGIDSKLKLMELKNTHPIYYYRFSFDAASLLDPSNDKNIKGVGHEEDLSYLFFIPGRPIPINHPYIATTINRYVRLLTNFAKYGNPTPPGKSDSLLNVTWPRSSEGGQILDINRDLKVDSKPISARVTAYELAGVGNSPILNECSAS